MSGDLRVGKMAQDLSGCSGSDRAAGQRRPLQASSGAVVPLPCAIPSRRLPLSRHSYEPVTSRRSGFEAVADDPAVAQLTAILQRAPFDGFAEGPQLAAQVQAAVGAGPRGKPGASAAAERVLSTAWVRYVQAIKRPTARHDLRLSGAAAAGHADGPDSADGGRCAVARRPIFRRPSNLNPVYAQLRDAAWAEAQASGNLTPDPRLLANLDRARSIPAQRPFPDRRFRRLSC